ncbi:MAG: tetratricopeptide repeat protein [Thermoplasmata archaeon]
MKSTDFIPEEEDNDVFEEKPQTILKLADELFLNNRYEEAAGYYTSLLEKFPDDAVLWNNKGVCLARLNMLNEAVECYSNAIRLAPSYDRAYFNRAKAYHRLGMLKKAIHDYKRCVRFNPFNQSAYNNIGVALSKLGKVKESLYYYKVAIEAKPDYEYAFTNMGYSLLKIGRVEEAQECFCKALALNNGFGPAAEGMSLVEELKRGRKNDVSDLQVLKASSGKQNKCHCNPERKVNRKSRNSKDSMKSGENIFTKIIKKVKLMFTGQKS